MVSSRADPSLLFVCLRMPLHWYIYLNNQPPPSKQIFWWRNAYWNHSSSILHPKHQSSKPEISRKMKGNWQFKNTTCHETKRQFFNIFDIFSAIFYFIFIAIEITMEMQHNRAWECRASDTFDVKLQHQQQRRRSPDGTNTSRREGPLSSSTGWRG